MRSFEVPDDGPSRSLWPRSNEIFVPAAEPLISIYVSPGVFLGATRLGVSRSARMPAAFFILMAVPMLIARTLTPLLLLLAGPALARTPYDGVWYVTVETRAGSCEPSAQYRMTVQDGKISGPADVFGTVAHEGMVKVTLNGAYAFGQLGGKIGSGKWNAAAAGKPCSGRWQATKE